MKLLIVTQMVDENDPILGFFCPWIQEFAKHCSKITVIALSVGKHHMPSNVSVHSLGKDKGYGRFTYTVRFYKYIWSMRNKYDVVFVHMNPEYICMAGIMWRILGKRIALWYTHKSVTPKLRIAEFLSNIIFTASQESFRLQSKKVHVVGHGIDTNFFTPNENINRDNWLLSVGRLTQSKRHDLAIHVAALVNSELRIVGEGPEHKILEALAKALKVKIRFLGGITQTQLREEYWRAAYLIHTSETGSLDKVVLEALACGLPVISTNEAFSNMPIIIAAADSRAIANALLGDQIDKNMRIAYVKENHSLQKLISTMLGLM